MAGDLPNIETSLIYYQLSDKLIMRYLHKGSQNQERLDALLSFGKSTSEDIKAALSDYLVRGISKTNAATLNGVKGPNFIRALKRLEIVAGKIEEVKELDWSSRLD